VSVAQPAPPPRHLPEQDEREQCVEPRPPLAEDPNLSAILGDLDRGLRSRSTAMPTAPPLMERLVVPNRRMHDAREARRPRLRWPARRRANGEPIGYTSGWTLVVACLVAMAFGASVAALVFDTRLTEMVARWERRR
jgi:hypothetical protein